MPRRKVTRGTRGKICVNNSRISKYILPGELDYYLNHGWVQGKLTKDGVPAKIPCKLCGKLISKYDSTSGICIHCWKSHDLYKEYWNTPQKRKEQSERAKRPRHAGFGQEQSRRMKEVYEKYPEQREIRRKAIQKSWKEGKLVPSHHSINHSKAELLMLQALTRMFGENNVCTTTLGLEPGRWAFPDAIIYQTVVVEYYGDFWHANPKIYKPNDIVYDDITAESIWKQDENRIERIRQYGYLYNNDYEDKGKDYTFISDIKVIWEYDTKHLVTVDDWVEYLSCMSYFSQIEEYASI